MFILLKASTGLLLLTLLAFAQPPYSDGFEGPALNRYWTVDTAGGAIGFTNTIVHGGAQSLRLNAAGVTGGEFTSVYHRFKVPIQGMFSVYVYDASPSAPVSMGMVLHNSEDANYSLFVGTTDDEPGCYLVRGVDSTQCGNSQQESVLNRSAGWHAFTVDVQPSEVTVYIDGSEVTTSSNKLRFDVVELRAMAHDSGSTAVFFDDFSYVVPSTMAPPAIPATEEEVKLASVSAQLQTPSPATNQVVAPKVAGSQPAGASANSDPSNVSYGPQALISLTSGSGNTAVGLNALQHDSSGSINTAVGENAARSLSVGLATIAIGAYSLFSATTSSDNTAVGFSSLYSDVNGPGNTMVGEYSGYSITGQLNNGLGRNALYYTTSGSSNIGIGYNAGVGTATANANVTGSNNVWIGQQSGPGSSTQHTNSVALGYQALVDQDNSGALGSSGMHWSIGGEQKPVSTLHLHDTGSSSGVTTLAIQAGAAQQQSPLQQWRDVKGMVLSNVSQAGEAFFPAMYLTGAGVALEGSGVLLNNAAGLRWSGDGTYYGAVDLGLQRSAPGVVEIDSGGSGTGGGLSIPSLRSTTGTRFVCVDTTGRFVSSAVPCSGS